MSLLSINHVFGIESCLGNSIYYLDEHCYLYRSIRHIILYNIDYKSQRLISYGNEYDKLEFLSVSPNKEYLGIVLNTLDKCRIIIYDISGTIQRKKILSLKQTLRSNYVLSIVFSNNSKFLLALYGEPDYNLVCWSIDQFKSVGIISLHIDLSYNPLNLQISFNPIDSSEMLVTGNHIFQQYRLNNGRFSVHGRCESMNITCHCWLNENHILLGLNTGFICTVNKHGDIIQQYNVFEVDQSNHLLYLSSDRSNFQSTSDRNISKIKSNSQLSTTLISNKTPSSTILLEQNQRQQRRSSSRSFHENNPKTQIINHNDIICLLPFSRGVFVSTGRGCVLMYEKSENNSQLTYLRKLILPSKNFSKQKSNEVIQSLALSPNEETLLAGTNTNHLYEFSFSKIDYMKEEPNIFTHALDATHTGPIITGAICVYKSILFTLGIDRCLKIWNLQTNNQELNHQFIDEPLSISIHPTGIFICVSFSNIVRIYVYTIDGLILFKQLQISNVRVIEYSNQGHILAIAYDNILQFHYHNDYDQPTYGRANTKKFRLIRWSHDDVFIISVDFDDLIIQWDPYTGQRLSEYQIEDFSVHDLLMSSDNKLAYILSSDKKIKEFFLMTIIRDINIQFDDCIPTAFLINNETRHLFIGSQNGSIYSIKLTQSNTMIDVNTSLHLLQMNVHQGAITKILISSENDLIISMGEDGNLIIYNLNISEQNKDSKIINRDEIFAKEILLKEQNIELNNLIKHELEITHKYENQIETKEEEYIEHLHQLDLHCQSNINTMQKKLTELREQKFKLKNEHEQKLNQLIEDKQYSIKKYLQEKNKYYKQILVQDQLIKSEIENFNEKTDLTNDSYKENIQLIHLSYKNKLNDIKNKFSKECLHINERIDHLEQMKHAFEEDNQFELINLHENYQMKLRKIFEKIEQLENEEVLLKTRVKQLEEESNRYENQIKQFEIERNQLVDHIQQIDNDFNLSKQIIQQRNFIIQEKLKRTNQMENRRDELQKFAYVFNYKIRQLTNQITPKQHEVNALIDLFNNMDNEYDLLKKNNEKYLIKIDEYKARLRAIQKQFTNETIAVRKLNETTTNINEDLKLCSYLINQPNKLIKLIRNIYGKYFIYIHTKKNFQEMNLFDYDRQRSFFERTNQRLQKNISTDFNREKIEQIRRIKEQINIMREISSYCLKVVQLERILSDLDIISNISTKINAKTPNQLIDELKIQQNSHFIQNKQSEFNFILNKQQKRIQQLRDLIRILELHLQQISDQCQTKLTFNFQKNSSIDQSMIISSNSIYSQTSTNVL